MVFFMSIWRGYVLFILKMMTSGFIKKKFSWNFFIFPSDSKYSNNRYWQVCVYC